MFHKSSADQNKYISPLPEISLMYKNKTICISVRLRRITLHAACFMQLSDFSLYGSTPTLFSTKQRASQLFWISKI